MPNKSTLFISLFSIAMIMALIGFTVTPDIHGYQYITDETRRVERTAQDGEVSFYHEYDKPMVVSRRPDQRVVIKVGARALKRPGPEERLPLNLAIVLDKSGSMSSQNKIENAKQGAIDMIDCLDERDLVSLIVFSDQAHVLISTHPLTDKNTFIRTIESIRADGSTALYSGVSLGAREVAKNVSPGYLNRIVLLSDGLANIGPQSNAEIFGLAENFIADNINVSAIGLGLSFNEQLMAGLAENSGGNFYYARSGDDLPGIFQREVNKSVTVVAQDIKIRIYAQNGSRTLGVIGPANIEGVHMVETWIPFLYGGEDKYRLVEMDLPPLDDGNGQAVARLEIEYFDPLTQQRQHYDEPLRIDATRDARLVERMTNKQVVKDVYLRRMAERKLEAVEFARQGNYEQASKILITTSVELQGAAKRLNDPDLNRASQQNRIQSRKVLQQQEYDNDMMNSDIMNIHQEFWG